MALANQPHSWERELDEALVDFALADYFDRQQRPHAAARHRRKVRHRCDQWKARRVASIPTALRARAVHVCALSDTLDGDPHVDAQWLRACEESPLSDRHERWYAEGRLYAFLPPGRGQNFGRAFVGLEFLSRSRPELVSARYWLARAADLQGNAERASQALPEQAPPPKAWKDGIFFGLTPRLFYLEPLGLGGALRWEDERIADQPRRAFAELSAGIRGNLSTRAEYEDFTVLPQLGWSVSGAASDGPSDYFGKGPVSQASHQTRLVGSQASATSRVAWWWDFLRFDLGWKAVWASFRRSDGPFHVADERDLFHGPLISFRWDGRDSRFDPRRGLLVTAEYFSPIRPRRVDAARFSVEAHLPWGLRQSFSAKVFLAATSTTAPFVLWPALGGTFEVPGTRLGRYRDYALLATSVETKRDIVGPLALGAFLTTGTLGPSPSSLPGQPWRWGTGGVAVWRLSALRRPYFRFESGVFGGEFVLTALLSQNW